MDAGAHPHKGLQRICNTMLLRDGLQPQPHLRHRPLIDGDDAVSCKQTHALVKADTSLCRDLEESAVYKAILQVQVYLRHCPLIS